MYRMILDSTLPDVVAAESSTAEDARPAEADAAAARTRQDYGRVSRWGLGLLGTAGAAIATIPLGVAVEVVVEGRDPAGDAVVAVLGAVIAAMFAVPSVWLLVALHRSGRRLARAAGYWAGLPYRQGRRSPTRGDWFAVRFLGFSSDLLLRLITSALAGLAAVFALALVSFSIGVRPSAAGLVIALASSILFIAVCVGQFGGVQRIQNGHLARDPASLTRRRS